ncbi:hypothetical protein QOT17_014142 [Balamuthia mandrillaris]
MKQMKKMEKRKREEEEDDGEEASGGRSAAWRDAYWQYCKAMEMSEVEEENTDTTWREYSDMDERRKAAAEALEQQILALPPDQREGIVKESAERWDGFYQANASKFFKDRNYLHHQFPLLADSDEPRTFLECGCGAGNTVFPLMVAHPRSFFYATDFSETAVNLVKQRLKENDEKEATGDQEEHKEKDGNEKEAEEEEENESGKEKARRYHWQQRAKVFVADLAKDELIGEDKVEAASSVDVALMIFVLSAVAPEHMVGVLKKIYHVLKPGGCLLFRDYGEYDLTQIRFLSKKDSCKLGRSLYVRSDGTTSYFFSQGLLFFCSTSFLLPSLMVNSQQTRTSYGTSS